MTQGNRVKTIELPTFFGPEESPLFGAVHLPADRRVRGAAILCGSLGKEQGDTLRGLRLLADALAALRIMAIRFDYLGVGDSSDAQVRVDSVSRWKESVRHAVAFAHECGAEEITAVGLRAGSLILESVVDQIDSIRNVVYWDPVGRGRAFIREQQSLYKLTVGSEDIGADSDIVPLIGTSLSAGAAKEFTDLDIRGDADGVKDWLVVRRPESTDRRVSAMVERTSASVITVEAMEAFSQPSSFLVSIPRQAVTGIATWIDQKTTRSTFGAEPEIRNVAEFDCANGIRIREQIERLGKQGVFAIRASPAGSVSEPARTVVLFSTANDTHIGPNREWVELSREVAAHGGQAIRWDRTGVGESGDPGAKSPGIYTSEAIAEAVEIGRLACAEPSGMLVAGVCSGSWYAAYVAREIGTGAVVLINAIAWSWRRKSAMTGEIDPSDLGVPRSDPEWQKTPRARVKSFLQQNLPYRMWRLLGMRGITQVPEVLLGPVVRADVDTTVVLSPHDFDWFVSQRGPEGLKRLQRSGYTPRIVETNVGDHTAYHSGVRAAVRVPILEWADGSGRND
ncbi:UNVERIFIED_CONTAM: hypothetical protein DES50_101218 [Williamsia faeni]